MNSKLHTDEARRLLLTQVDRLLRNFDKGVIPKDDDVNLLICALEVASLVAKHRNRACAFASEVDLSIDVLRDWLRGRQ